MKISDKTEQNSVPVISPVADTLLLRTVPVESGVDPSQLRQQQQEQGGEGGGGRAIPRWEKGEGRTPRSLVGSRWSPRQEAVAEQGAGPICLQRNLSPQCSDR